MAVMASVIPVSAVGNAPPPMNVDATPGGDTLIPCFDDGGSSCEIPEEVRELHIRGEHLVFDVDADSTAGFDAYGVTVSATYEIEHRGTETVSGSVRFIAAGTVGEQPHEVRFDGERIEATVGQSTVPRNWELPERAPGFDGDDYPMFGWHYEAGGPYPSADDYRNGTAEIETLDFDLEILPGEHTLAVTYRLAPTHIEQKPHQIAAIPYVLAPADEWGSFGGLDIEVRVPEGYRIASSLPLDDEQGVYVGSFDGLPADSLAVTVSPDPSAFRLFFAHQAWLWPLPLFLLLAAAIGALIVRNIRGWSEGWVVFLKICTVPLFVTAIMVGWVLFHYAAESILCPYPDVSPHLQALGYLLMSIPVGALALLAMAIGAFIARWRSD